MNEQLPPLPEPVAKHEGGVFVWAADWLPTRNLDYYTADQMRDYARAALAMSPKVVSGTSLPPPDMTMPSMTPDGPEGAHYYRASTVRRLLENKGEQA